MDDLIDELEDKKKPLEQIKEEDSVIEEEKQGKVPALKFTQNKLNQQK